LTLLAGTGYIDYWGIYHLSIFPNEVAVGIIVLAFILIWLPARTVSWMFDRFPGVSGRRGPNIVILAVLAVVAVVLFYAGRSGNLLLGDGYKRVQMMQQPIDFWPTEYVDLLAHRLLFKLVESAEVSYLITGIASGIVFLAAVYLFIRELRGDRITSVAAWLIVTGLAQIQFFFGYVESYAIMAALSSLFLLFGYRYASDRKQLGLAIGFFVVSGIFHLTAWFFLPGVIYLLILHSKRTGNAIYKSVSVIIVSIALILAAVYYFKFEGNRIFVPLIPTATNPYSLLSINHLYDIAKELLLVAPIPLILTLGVLITKRGKNKWQRPEFIFPGLCALGGLFVLVAVDPILGAVRDWDLLSLYGLPLAFLAVSLVRTVLDDKKDRAVVIIISIAILIAHTVPWVISNTRPVLAKDLMKRAIARDVHYTPEYYDGYLLKQWAFYIEDNFKDYEEMERAALLRVKADPDDPGALLMYALGCHFSDKREELLWALDRLDNIPATGVDQLGRALRYRLQYGDIEKLEQSVKKAIRKYPNDRYIKAMDWVVSRLRSDPDAVEEYLTSLITSYPDNIQLLTDYAAACIIMKRYSKAKSLLDRAESYPQLQEGDSATVAVMKRRLNEKLNSR